MRIGTLVIALLVIVFLQSCHSQAGSIADYKEARKLFWQELYPAGGATLYCGKKFGAGYNKNINIEHVFPMGWVTHAVQCGTRKQCRQRSEQFNRIEADLHNLYPSQTSVNKARGSFRFGIISGEERRFGQACDFEVSERQRHVEPAEAVRGDVARAMLYMEKTYASHGLEIFNKQRKMLVDWHFDDPPSAQERARNDRIAQIQGNRNPFIDNPSLSN